MFIVAYVLIMSILNRKNVYATIENHIVFVETFKTAIIRKAYEKLELVISKKKIIYIHLLKYIN